MKVQNEHSTGVQRTAGSDYREARDSQEGTLKECLQQWNIWGGKELKIKVKTMQGEKKSLKKKKLQEK